MVNPIKKLSGVMHLPGPLIQLEETDSTNNHLARLCDDKQASVPELTTVAAEYQTAGKGQRGNTWESARGENLLFSFVLYPTFLEARRQFVLLQLVALAIKEELDAQTAGITIKWPNDIYWKEKKICGFLMEHDLDGTRLGRSICGVGIDINQERFLSDAPNPVSLRQITGKEHDRANILSGVLHRVAESYQRLRTDTTGEYAASIAVRYHQSLYRLHGLHTYEDAQGTFRATLLRVEADGRLVLRDENGKERSYLFKEVKHVGQ